MTTRGLTMIEVLAALVVLGLASSALVPWLRAAVREARPAEVRGSDSLDPSIVKALISARDPWDLSLLEVGGSSSVVVPGSDGAIVSVRRATGRDGLGGSWFTASSDDRERAFWMPIRASGEDGS